MQLVWAPMLVTRTEGKWNVAIEEQDNQLGLINTIRYLEKLNDEITEEEPQNLLLELNLAHLHSANSELIAQFVMLQSTLVRTDGRLKIVEANPELKSSFDVVMLDKIIGINYLGQEDDSEDGYAYEEE